MKKIVTLTFSPCIDKSTSVQSLIPEKKLLCSVPIMEPGGGGINIARAIKKLGGEASAVYPSGGYTGKFFTHLLEKENITSVIIDTVHETRENIIVVDESTNNQYRFGMPGTELLKNEWQACLKAVEGIKNAEFIIASGSLPPGVPLDIYAQLAKIAQQNNAKLIIDASSEALKQALEQGIYLLKPNLGELSALVGEKELQPNAVKDVAQSIIAKGNCEVWWFLWVQQERCSLQKIFLKPSRHRLSLGKVRLGQGIVWWQASLFTFQKEKALLKRYNMVSLVARQLP